MYQHCCPFCMCVFRGSLHGCSFVGVGCGKGVLNASGYLCVSLYVQVGLTLADLARGVKSSPPAWVSLTAASVVLIPVCPASALPAAGPSFDVAQLKMPLPAPAPPL